MKPEDITRKSSKEDDGNDVSRSANRSKKSGARRRRQRTNLNSVATEEVKSEHNTETGTNQKSESTKTSSVSSTRNDNAGNGQPHSTLVNAPGQRSGMKKFFLKFTEKIGALEKTEYSKDFLSTCKEVDNYKLALEDMLRNMLLISQQNPRYTPQPLERMEFEYPANENPFELLEPAMQTFASLLKDGDIDKQLKLSGKLGVLHRDFHRRVRRVLRDIRYFLCIEYEELNEARRILNQRRQDMDYAKHELKSAKAPEVIEMKNTVYEHTQKQFDEELNKVLQKLDQFPRQRDTHLKNIVTFFGVYRYYHEEVSSALKS